MRRHLLILSALALVPAGCADRAPDADVPEAEPIPSADIFAGLPVLQGARLVGGSANAAEAVVAVPVAADSVGRFYRRILVDRDWEIRGDATTPDGQVTLHARSPEGRPIWIMVRPTGPARSEISVIATVVDTAVRR